ncbi:pyridoxamine 5'-phosphate oxidase family protein [Actinoplanes sp. NPDC023936]|uniref:pyridoxamine 5'-phosphate oxidase family protein n=1 Tax=Actinoplanes sp. NPDC023936 TaxID=3154910 RepID=UPI003406A125
MNEDHAAVRWTDDIDAVLGGDLTAALTYVTPAGGAVAVAVAPVGLRDREKGWVAFTTSLGFGKKLERITRDPRVALAYHSREHGTATGDRYVLVQGHAEIVPQPDPELAALVRRQATAALGPPLTGVFWDRWLREYYQVRVPVLVRVRRVTSWPDLRAAGEPLVLGAAPVPPPAPQNPPASGTWPRVDVQRTGDRFRKHPHRLLSYRGSDGYPVTVPIEVRRVSAEGIELAAAPGLIPDGARRAGLLTHSFGPQLVGLSTRYHTGWLSKDATGKVMYFPHTASGFSAPRQKALQMFATGLMAKRGLRASRRASAP